MSHKKEETFWGRLKRFLQDWSIPLIVGVLIALIWANVDHHSYEHFVETKFLGPLSVHFFANEILMVFFFGIAAKEITEAVLPGGDLHPLKKAVNPLLGTLGGIFGPIGIYFLMTKGLNAPEIMRGWGIPTATDIALAWLVARIVFGPKHAAVSYLLLLAVADDAGGMAIIALFYPDPNHPVEYVYLILVAVAMFITWGMRRRDLNNRKEGEAPKENFLPYMLPGALSWLGFYAAHLHPALALTLIVPLMPTALRDEGMYAEGESDHKTDALNAFEHFFKAPVDYGLVLFGLANAGVVFSSIGPATWAVLVALVVGKTVGITVASYGGHLAGFPLPNGMNLKTLVLAGLTASLGLTVALFVAGAAFTDPAIQGAAKMGALFSAGVGFLVWILGRLLRVEKVYVEEKKPQLQLVKSSQAESEAA